MSILSVILKGYKKIVKRFKSVYETPLVKLYLKANNVQYGKGLISNGFPTIDIREGGKMVIGDHFRMNNGKHYNKIGRQQSCIFVVGNNAELCIGNNVGASGVAIVCRTNICVGDNVKFGGNVVIYDTDFHSLNAAHRSNLELDFKNTVTRQVIIGNNTFIGAHSIILKGVTIGENSIIGAGSVVSKSIPANEIWAGNPAIFIRSLKQ